jgi:hypothetical protein
MSTIVVFRTKRRRPIEQADLFVMNPAIGEWPKEKASLIVVPCPKADRLQNVIKIRLCWRI